jgi:acyl carrier protein
MYNAEAVRRFVTDRMRAQAQQKNLLLEKLTDEVNLVETGLFDSLGFVTLIATVEEEFDVEVDFGEVDPETFTTLGGIIQCALAAVPSLASRR